MSLWSALAVVLLAEPTAADLDAAEAQIKSADGAYAATVRGWLGSPNAFLRFEGLKRLEALPALATPEALAAAVGLIDDDTPIYRRDCIGADDTYAHAIGQGQIYHAAQCIHSAQQHCSTLARKIVARAMPDERLTALLIDKALAYRKPHVGLMVDPADEVLRLASSVPAKPFLDRLSKPLGADQLGSVLEYALWIHGSVGVDAAQTPLPRLLESADRRTQARAALLVLLVAPEKDPLRPKATELVTAALSTPDGEERLGEGVAADLTKLRGQARAFVEPLCRRARAPNAWRGWTFEALAGIGDEGACALPAAVAHLSCRSESCVEPQVLDFLAALGAKGRPAADALLDAAARDPQLLPDATAALAAVGARPTPAAWKKLRGAYAKACHDAGSIPFFSLDNDDACARIAANLQQLATQAGLPFKEVGWEG